MKNIKALFGDGIENKLFPLRTLIILILTYLDFFVILVRQEELKLEGRIPGNMDE